MRNCENYLTSLLYYYLNITLATLIWQFISKIWLWKLHSPMPKLKWQLLNKDLASPFSFQLTQNGFHNNEKIFVINWKIPFRVQSHEFVVLKKQLHFIQNRLYKYMYGLDTNFFQLSLFFLFFGSAHFVLVFLGFKRILSITTFLGAHIWSLLI